MAGDKRIIHIPYVTLDQQLAAWIFASIFVIAACGISAYLIYKHLKYYTQPDHQRYIVRILCMVPLYGIYSLLSLIFYDHQIYLAIARDCYEAYALYMFFALCVQYAGGNDVLVAHFISQPPARLTMPLWCKVQHNELFLRVCRQGMLQYVILRPIVSIWSGVLQIFGVYGDGVYSSHGGYLYASIINNVCVTIALYVIVLFEQAAAELLHPYRPFLKFISIKIVIFLCFWQSVAISVMVHLKWLKATDELPLDQLTIGLQNFLICFEMFIVSILHITAFPYELYRVRALTRHDAPLMRREKTSVLKNTLNMINHKDLIVDTVDSFHVKKKADMDQETADKVYRKHPTSEAISDSSAAAVILIGAPKSYVDDDFDGIELDELEDQDLSMSGHVLTRRR